MKRILVVSSDVATSSGLGGNLRLDPDFEVQVAKDAGEALASMRQKLPDALVIEQRLVYGDAVAELDGRSDPDGWEAGFRVIEQIVRTPEYRRTPPWIAILMSEERKLSSRDPWVGCVYQLYSMPFNDAILEDDLRQAMTRVASVVRTVY